MAGQGLSGDGALHMLFDGPNPARDAIRRAYMEGRTAEDVIAWMLLAADVLAKKHPKAATSIPGMLEEVIGVRRAGEQAASS